VVKPLCADDCVRSPHAKVGHRQASNTLNPVTHSDGVFFRLFLMA
ncbi:MAG: hypothetical protein RIT27_1253, partial [Pseudomonadota bacterium]